MGKIVRLHPTCLINRLDGSTYLLTSSWKLGFCVRLILMSYWTLPQVGFGDPNNMLGNGASPIPILMSRRSIQYRENTYKKKTPQFYVVRPIPTYSTGHRCKRSLQEILQELQESFHLFNLTISISQHSLTSLSFSHNERIPFLPSHLLHFKEVFIQC